MRTLDDSISQEPKFRAMRNQMFPYLGITFLLLRAGAHHDLQLGLVQRHQAQVQSGEEATETEEDTEQNHAGPSWQQWPPGKIVKYQILKSLNINHRVATFL